MDHKSLPDQTPREEAGAVPTSPGIVYTPIGRVKNAFFMPGDPKDIRNSESLLVIDGRYRKALEGIESYRYLLVVYHIDRSPGYREKVHPMGDESIAKRGVLATRSPCRPNPVGITVVEVLAVEGTTLRVTGLDALDETPILDLKPYMEHFDAPFGLHRERDPGYRPGDGPQKSSG